MSVGVNDQTPSPAVHVVPDSLSDELFGVGGFPSANLLPPAIINRRAVQGAQRRALVMLLGVLALLFVAFVITVMQQGSANAAKEQAQSRVDVAAAQKQRYAYVPAVYSAVTTAREDLATAMGQEVQVSRLMGGLSAMQPPGLSLTVMQAEVGPGSQETMTSADTVIPGVGTVTMEGEAISVDLIAAWLERMKLNPDYQDPVLTSVTKSTTDDLYTFTASASLTERALSGRYVREAG